MADRVEFVKLVAKMRKLQRLYFAQHSRSLLEQCKVTEAKVDKILAQYEFERGQMGMWGRNDKEHEEPGLYDVGGMGEPDAA